LKKTLKEAKDVPDDSKQLALNNTLKVSKKPVAKNETDEELSFDDLGIEDSKSNEEILIEKIERKVTKDVYMTGLEYCFERKLKGRSVEIHLEHIFKHNFQQDVDDLMKEIRYIVSKPYSCKFYFDVDGNLVEDKNSASKTYTGYEATFYMSKNSYGESFLRLNEIQKLLAEVVFIKLQGDSPGKSLRDDLKGNLKKIKSKNLKKFLKEYNEFIKKKMNEYILRYKKILESGEMPLDEREQKLKSENDKKIDKKIKEKLKKYKGPKEWLGLGFSVLSRAGPIPLTTYSLIAATINQTGKWEEINPNHFIYHVQSTDKVSKKNTEYKVSFQRHSGAKDYIVIDRFLINGSDQNQNQILQIVTALINSL
jgi:hypothetical protein